LKPLLVLTNGIGSKILMTFVVVVCWNNDCFMQLHQVMIWLQSWQNCYVTNFSQLPIFMSWKICTLVFPRHLLWDITG